MQPKSAKDQFICIVDLDREVKLKFSLERTGEIDLSEALKIYSKCGRTETIPQDAITILNTILNNIARADNRASLSMCLLIFKR